MNEASIDTDTLESSFEENKSDYEEGSSDEVDQLLDKNASIQEWLFSSSLPTFTPNDKVFSWIKNEEDLSAFFKFILIPFRGYIHAKGKRRLGKLTQRLKIHLPNNGTGEPPFKYHPVKHNQNYYRAQKMLMCFFYKENLRALKQQCPNFINSFCKIISNPRRYHR